MHHHSRLYNYYNVYRHIKVLYLGACCFSQGVSLVTEDGVLNLNLEALEKIH